MSIVVEGDKVTIIIINTGSGNDWPSKIATNVFGDDFRITFIRLGINIETFFVIFIAGRLNLFESRTDFRFHLIQKGSAEGITKESIVKVFYIAPETIITVAPFRDKTMYAMTSLS